MIDSVASGPPEYLEAWSLRCHPFEQRLDPQFFYAGSALMQRLDLLTHMIQFGDSIALVCGPPGSGKSSLLEQFLGHINPQWVVCLMDCELGEQLSDRIAETVGGTPDDDDEPSLLARWAAHSEASQHMVVVIDNAEQLDESACKRLCALTGLPDSERLRIVLFGTSDTEQHIRAALEKIDSKRNYQMLDIPKLTEEETASYLMYRLAVAGYSGESPFTPTEVRAIRKSADGRPGKINRLAHSSLIEHYLRAKNNKRAPVRRTPTMNTTPLWIGGSITIAAIAAFLGWQRFTPTTEPEPDHAAITLPREQALAEPPLELPVRPRPADNPNDKHASRPEPPLREKQVSAMVAEPQETGEAIAAAAIITVKSDTTSAAITDVPTTPVAPTAPIDTPTENATPPANEDTDTKTPPAQPSPALADGQLRGEDWLMQQHPDVFTLQLLGSRDESSINAHSRRNALDPAKTAYYRGRYRNADWYVLLYGVYPDKAAALAARRVLPENLQKTKPWPRSLKSVQDSIREAQ